MVLEDIERIEVIRGPGATLSGANAVNGVVNIITKRAKDTQSGLVTAGGGSQEGGVTTVRYGGTLWNRGHYRFFTDYLPHYASTDSRGREATDDWRFLHGGFRTDWVLSSRDDLTVEGDLYKGNAGQSVPGLLSLSPPTTGEFNDRTNMSGGNLLGRWHRTSSERFDTNFQMYMETAGRNEARLLGEHRHAIDLDLEQHLGVGTRHDLVWGGDYRYAADSTSGSLDLSFNPIARPELLRGVKALIVDDNRTNRGILEGMLKRWEMKSTSVEGGEEAFEQLSLARAAGDPYGLILTDVHMPKMDGFSLVERIRLSPQLATATIMMLTSAGHRGDAARCQKLGVAAYLLKPIRQSELREALARVLGAKEQEGVIPLITRYSLQDARDPSAFLSILVAEDNAVNQRLAARLLEKRGHRVVVAANGREALAALEKDTFDIVLMDVQMPEMDGLEATIAIRKKEELSGNHQAVVALTAHAMKGDQERCVAVGMDGYLSKPIRPQELDAILEWYLARRGETVNTHGTPVPTN